jgi:steroid delta-isomerase-like uncharacterized protein
MKKTSTVLTALPVLSIAFASTVVACGGDAQTAPPPVAPTAPSESAAIAPPPATTQDTTPPPAPKPSLAEMQKTNINAMIAAFNAHDVKKLMSVYAADAVNASPSGEGWKKESRDEIEQGYTKLFTEVPDAKWGLVRVLVKGADVAFEWVGNGAGGKVGFRAASIASFNADGLITQERVYIDGATIAQQLGKAPGKPRAFVALPTADATWLTSTSADDGVADKAKATWPLSWPKHDRKAYEASITDDFVHEEIASPMDYVGKKAAMGEFDTYAKAIPDMAVSVDNTWTAGGITIIEFTFSGTQKGALGPLKATGKKFSVHGVDFIQMNGDKLQKATTYSNGVELLSQLGLMPKKDDGMKKDGGAPKKDGGATPPAKK